MKEQAKKRPYHRFTEQEKQFISRWYAKVNTCCIAHLLGLTTEQVKKFAERKRGDRNDRVWCKNALIISEINARNRSLCKNKNEKSSSIK